MMLLGFACTKSTSLSPENGSFHKIPFKVAKIEPNSAPLFSTSKEILAENMLKWVPGIYNIKDHAIEKFGNTYYWTAKATAQNKTNVAIAVELTFNGNNDFYNLVATGNTHTCTSQAGCNGCEFVRGTEPHHAGQIIGCRCTMRTASDGKCQYSVTTVEK
jgi:hypothetical protein